MVAEAADLPAHVELPDGVEVRQVTDPAGVELVMEVHCRAFGADAPWLRRHLLAHLGEGPEAAVVFVVMAGEMPVGSARIEFCPGTDFAGSWGGGTVPAWRGRGLYRALLSLRARLAVERGYRYVQVDASDQSRPILRRLGFEPLTTTAPFVA